MQVIYIGDKYYWESSSTMSSVYKVVFKSKVNGDEWKEHLERTDWGLIQIALQEGEEVIIKPATKKQLKHFDKMLDGIT